MTGILVNVAISNYFMVIAMFVLGIAFVKLRNWYISSAKDIKHLEGIGKYCFVVLPPGSAPVLYISSLSSAALSRTEISILSSAYSEYL